MRKIVIAGGTGFIGTYLKDKFTAAGYEVFIISRAAKHISWNDNIGIITALEDAELLINLAGKSVDCRYTAKNKALIMSSRVATTNDLQKAVNACTEPPKLWINSSTATIYRYAEDHAMDEATGETGIGFSVEVAKAWEAAFFAKKNDDTRKVALRIAIVLGPNGGVMTPYKNLVRYGLGGRQGSGRQMFSWIHIEDLYQIILFVLHDQQIAGVYNAAAPYPVTNSELMQTFRKIMHPIFALPSPVWLLRIGAMFIKTETELVLKSRWVVPSKFLAAGYKFRYDRIKGAVGEILADQQQTSPH